MNIVETPLKGALIIEPKVFNDVRGYFFESFSQRDFDAQVAPLIGHKVQFVQDNESMSSYGVMRGLHFQRPPYTQSKLLRCVRGAVLDVAVDIRKGSPTYGQYVSTLLTAENFRQFYIPAGFAHGFTALEDDTVFAYKCSNFYNKASEGCIMFNDKDLNIDWQIENPITSEKDMHGEAFATFVSPFEY